MLEKKKADNKNQFGKSIFSWFQERWTFFYQKSLSMVTFKRVIKTYCNPTIEE
jgi:hypothetical protein